MPRQRRRSSGWPPPRQGNLGITCPAPSATPGHPFTLALAGAWEELPSPRPHHNPDAAATHHALTVARNITATLTPNDTVLAAARINTLLGHPTEIPGIPVRLTWARVTLTTTPEALSASARHQQHQHEEEQRRTEQARRINEARTLRDTLMSDPSLALAYWFATAPQTVDETTLTRLEQLHVQAAAYAPQGCWAQLARLLHAFVGDLPEDTKTHLIGTLASLTDRYGHPEIAVEIDALRQPPVAEQPLPRHSTAE